MGKKPLTLQEHGFALEALTDFAPPHIAIGPAHDVLSISDGARRFMDTHDTGAPVTDQIKPELAATLQSLLTQSQGSDGVRTLGYHGTLDDTFLDMTMASKPMADGNLLIVFSDVVFGQGAANLSDFAKVAERQTALSMQRLAEIEELYAASPLAMALVGPDGRYIRVNQGLADINGMTIAECVGQHVRDVVPDLTEQVLAPIEQVLKTGQKIKAVRVTGHTAKDPQDERIWDTDWYPVRLGDQILGVGINVRDVTEHVQLSMELRRVMQELQHRVKNMLANVLALVSRAGRDATQDRDVYTALSKRIYALSQTHKLLTQSNWNATNLRNVLEPELTAIHGEGRVELNIPDIMVNARAALALAMAIHELATNAVKYGSFSVPDGLVKLTWDRTGSGESDDFVATWQETGGPPPVTERRTGFGSQLIRSTIEGSLSGKVEFRWEPEGLVCVMKIPASALVENRDENPFYSL